MYITHLDFYPFLRAELTYSFVDFVFLKNNNNTIPRDNLDMSHCRTLQTNITKYFNICFLPTL